MKSSSISNAFTSSDGLAALLFLAILLALTTAHQLNSAIVPQDEGILLVYPDLILRGNLPYRDFAAIYPPGTFYVIAAAFYLFGESIYVERFIGLGYWFLMALSVYVLGSRRSTAIGFLSATAVLLILVNDQVGAYAVFPAWITILLALICIDFSYDMNNLRRQNLLILLSGVLSGLTFWFRLDFGISGAVAVGATLFLEEARRLRLFLTGAAAPASALIGFALAVGMPETIDSLIFDVRRNAPGRYLPLEINYWLIGLALCGIFNVVALLTTFLRRDYTSRFWLVRVTTLSYIGLLPSVLQRADIGHILYVASGILPLSIISISSLFRKARHCYHFRSSYTALLAGSAIIAVLIPIDRWRVNTETVSTLSSSGRTVIVSANSAADTSALIDDVNRVAVPGERLFVGPSDLRFSNYNDTFLYFLLPQLRPASRYLEMNPGCANRVDSGLQSQLLSADWIVLTSRYDSWSEPNDSGHPGSSIPNRVVSRRFCLRSEHGAWKLFGRCSSGDKAGIL